MTDYLKTAKSLTHDGWVGAKIEMHFPASREIVVNNDIYGYPVVGVSGFTAFGRRDGSTFSRDLDLSKLEITRNEENFKIKVLTDVNWDFYRVNFDVAVRQVDLDKNLAVSFSGTERLVITVKKGDSKVSIPISSQSSLPKFIGGSDSYSYVWYGNSLKKSKLTKINNQLEVELAVPAQEEIKLEIPLAVFLRDKKGPVVKYLL